MAVCRGSEAACAVSLPIWHRLHLTLQVLQGIGPSKYSNLLPIVGKVQSHFIIFEFENPQRSVPIGNDADVG
jgi:hypothetical protein